MKEVYLAEDLNLHGRRCALAEMIDSFPDASSQALARNAFDREAELLASLQEEHIPRIFDAFSDRNKHYLVMEYIDGDTLEQKLITLGGRLREQEIVSISREILAALEYLHSRNPPIIYRDMKPSNVMITKGGQIKLIDFGIARHFRPVKTATIIGTQGYAPPEQYRGKAEPRSDFYSLAALIHYLLSGRDPTAEPPFSFPPIRQIVPNCSPEFGMLIDDALAYNIDLRPASASEFDDRLIKASNAIDF